MASFFQPEVNESENEKMTFRLKKDFHIFFLEAKMETK